MLLLNSLLLQHQRVKENTVLIQIGNDISTAPHSFIQGDKPCGPKASCGFASSVLASQWAAFMLNYLWTCMWPSCHQRQSEHTLNWYSFRNFQSWKLKASLILLNLMVTQCVPLECSGVRQEILLLSCQACDLDLWIHKLSCRAVTLWRLRLLLWCHLYFDKMILPPGNKGDLGN